MEFILNIFVIIILPIMALWFLLSFHGRVKSSYKTDKEFSSITGVKTSGIFLIIASIIFGLLSLFLL